MADVIAVEDTRRLKGELQALRRKGALRAGDWHSQDAGDSERACARCRAELGRIVNRGAFCRACRLRVCKACREYSLRTADWVCSVCHKHMEIQMATGEWMNEYVRRPSRRRDNRVFVPPADVVKRSIRRSWTISNPSPRWSSLRGSAELRAYSSLPRHNDHPSSETKLSPVVRRPSRGRRLPSSDTEASPRRKTSARNPEPRSTVPARTDDVLTEMSTQQRRSFCTNRDSSSGIGSDGSCPGQSPCDSLDRKEVGAVVGHWESAMGDFETPGQRRSLITDGISRTSALMRQGSPAFPRRREARVEYSGTSDSGGEKRGEPAMEAGEAPVFKRVTVKRRRQDPRKIGDSGMRARRPRDSVRCIDANRRCLSDDPNLPDYLLETEGDDYKLVFISSDSSSKEEEFSHSDDADADSSSTSSTTSTANLTVDDCDWDYFEASSMVRPVLRDWNWHNRRSSPSVPESGQSTAEDSPLPARRPIYPARKREAAASKSSSEHSTVDGEQPESAARSQFDVSRCAVCKSCGSKAQPAIALPIPVPVPASFWPSDAGLGDIVYSAQRDGDGSIRIRIRSLKTGVDGPWCLVPVKGVDVEAEGDARDVSLEMVLVKEKRDETKTGKEDEMKINKEVEIADEVNSVKKEDRRETDSKTIASCDTEVSRGPIKLSMITQCEPPDDKELLIHEEATQADHAPAVEMDQSDDGVVLVLCRPIDDDDVDAVQEPVTEFLPGEVTSATSSDSDDAKPPVERVYHFHDGDQDDEITSSEETTDDEDAGDGSRFSTVFVVNGEDSDVSDAEARKEGDDDADGDQGKALHEHVSDDASDVILAVSEVGLCTVGSSEVGPEGTRLCEISADKEELQDDERDVDEPVAANGDCDNSVLEKEDCVLKMIRPDEVKVVEEMVDNDRRPKIGRLEDVDEASEAVTLVLTTEVTDDEFGDQEDAEGIDMFRELERIEQVLTEEGVELEAITPSATGIEKNLDKKLDMPTFSEEEIASENDTEEISVKESCLTEQVSSTLTESVASLEDPSLDRTPVDPPSTSTPHDEVTTEVASLGQEDVILAEQVTACSDPEETKTDVNKTADAQLTAVDEITETVTALLADSSSDHLEPISDHELLASVPATLADNVVEECIDVPASLTEAPLDSARVAKTGEQSDGPGVSLSVGVDQTEVEVVGGDVGPVVDPAHGKKAKKKRKNGKDKVCEEVKKDQVKPCDKSQETSRKSRKKGKSVVESVVVPEPQVFVDDVIAVSDVVPSECCSVEEDEKKDAGKKNKKRNKRFGKWGKRRKNKPGAEPEEVAVESVVAEPDRPEVTVAGDAVQVNDTVDVENATPTIEIVDADADTCESLFFDEEHDSSCDEEDGEIYKQLPSFVDRSLVADPNSPVERFTSLVMITQEPPPFATGVPGEVSVVTNDTTRLVDDDDVVVKHTNWEDDDVIDKAPLGGLAGYFTLTLESSPKGHPPRRPTVTKSVRDEDVVVVTGGDTMSAVVCLEEGIADDDSWVEEIDDRDEDEFATTTPTDSSSGDEAVVTPCTVYGDREEELRGYHRSAIDFTLHTIVEESCEESEAEPERRRKSRPVSASELEKYFFFGLGEGNTSQREADSISECSSVYSEGVESAGGDEEGVESQQAEDLASSRLEKYFLSGFMGFAGPNGESRDSDGSGSVGSDSEGRPSPEQRRKRLVRARGTGRQHSNSNSLDNLVAVAELEAASPSQETPLSEGSSTETDDVAEGFEKADVDTVKRKKKKHRASTPEDGDDVLEDVDERIETPQPEVDVEASRAKQQSRDSGFIGSCDDLLKVPDKTDKVLAPSKTMEVHNGPPAVSLTRKDSFNNWSSDEETNLMMSKMRAFFKTMVAVKPTPSSPAKMSTHKPPQLVYFENELTRLMKTVPGIRDEQVREIVEYLSSEDTWSDSYDSSDYTSSDLEGAVAFYQQTAAARTELQEQISASCQQIINKFDTTTSEEPPSKDTAAVYQRLVASFSKMSNESDVSSSPHSSPPLLAKVMHHIGSRLVALMHEVSSPKIRARRTSSASTTTSEDDELQLPRSQSHDLLLARPGLRSSSSGVSDQDERFSWRGSFESALLAGDSRTKLSAAKRRSAGDLASSNKNSREQLDRVRSCGSIGVEEKIWGRRRSSVPDANTSGASNDGDDDDDDDDDDLRSVTLPRSLQTSLPAGTNSLPRLPTSTSSAAMHKSTGCVKSARYRPPGFNTRPSAPKRAVSAPGLHQRRDNQRRRLQASNPTVEEKSISEETTSTPTTPSRHLHGDVEEDIDRLVAIHQQRTSLSSLGPRSDSMASVYSGAGESRYGTVAVRGEVEFSLSYNYKSSALEISVKQCRDLAAVDAKRNRSDPYVKVYLLPDKSKSGKRKTKVKKHTLNPIFDETLKFSVGLEELESRTLWLTVWHSDMFGRNDFLGEVMMSMENKVFDDPSPRFYHLNERTEPFDDLATYKGDLILALKFVPPDVTVVKKGKRSRGALHVLVKEGKNLTAVKAVGTSDPFCKCYLLPDKGRASKQKTPVARRTCNPMWNYTFVYEDVSLQELSERCLELTAWDHDRLASNEFLGGLRFSLGTGKHHGKTVDWMDAGGKELQLWQSMLQRPNFWVEGSLALRPSLEQRSAV